MLLKTVFLILLTTPCYSQNRTVHDFKLGQLRYEDQFNTSLTDWTIETSSSNDSVVISKDNSLIIDANAGVTVWFNKKIKGNVCFEYKRKVTIADGKNDRLSDLNTFWMAIDPKSKNLFTRTGNFKEYDSLLMYYVGFGGNTNTTTRFRKYEGNGERKLLAEYLDASHLLQANKEYTIRIFVHNGKTSFFVDDEEYFSYVDPQPIKAGYFGFRTVQSRQEIKEFKVYQLK